MKPANPTEERYPTSPCIQVCSLDDGNRCLGCHRTIREIVGWARMTAAEQRAVIRQLPERASSRAATSPAVK